MDNDELRDFQRPSVAAMLDNWAADLARAGVPSPTHDARSLAAHVLGVRPGELFWRSSLEADDVIRIEELVRRRATREPLQYITGSVSFLGLDIHVGPGVFVPRPETELMADHVVKRLLPGQPGREGQIKVVDLCTGSGVLGLALATNVAGVVCVGVEKSATAALYARRNALSCSEKLIAQDSSFEVIEADAVSVAGTELAHLQGAVDVVVCNPPYVPDSAFPREIEARDYDPAEALYGGPDGLAVVRQLIVTAATLLRTGGLLATEHADSQGENADPGGVPSLLREYRLGADEGRRPEAAFEQVVDHRDLNDRPRFTTAIKSGHLARG